MSEGEGEKLGRPMQDISAEVAETSAQIGLVCNWATAILTEFYNGRPLGVKPCPQFFPIWEIEFRLIPKG